MTTLLITGIGGDLGQSAAQIVREARPSWRIIGVDMHERQAGLLYADAFEPVPSGSSVDYLEALTGVLQRHRAEYCLPTTEAELRAIHQTGMPSIAGATLVGVSGKALSIGLDKLATNRFLTSIGIPVPWTVEASVENVPREYPCMFKLRRSSGSRSVVICRDREQALGLVKQEADGIFQELLLPAESEMTCAVFRTSTRRTLVLPMVRRLAGGLTVWMRIHYDKEVVRQCETIAEAMDLAGPINVQLRVTDNGPRIFEINPRFSSTLYLRHLLGFRDLLWAFDDLMGKDIEYHPPLENAEAVRTFGAAVLPAHG
jgi:carbamoyl-phosphate synthase large subunit